MQGNGEAIKVIRERSGWSQAQLSTAADVEQSALNRIEAGKRPGTPEQLVSIARALKCSIIAIICACPEGDSVTGAVA